MVIDLKQHIITLAAVFLALALGMLVGSMFISGASVEHQVASGLQKEFGQLRDENREQRSEIESLRSRMAKRDIFENIYTASVIHKRLPYYRVAIIQTGDYSNATQVVRSALETAGARVVSVTTVANLGTDTSRKRAAEAAQLITGTPSDESAVKRVVELLAQSLAETPDPRAMRVLEEKGLLTTSGDYENKAIRIVIVGGGKKSAPSRAREVDLVLVDRLQKAGVLSIVGVEPVDADLSYTSIYHLKSISTVDDVDEPMGQVSLVYAVAGEEGHYGIKKSADRVVPAGLENGTWQTQSR